jgi:peptidoglycan hydrolase-like protein with peptidoglycan-binding domain
MGIRPVDGSQFLNFQPGEEGSPQVLQFQKAYNELAGGALPESGILTEETRAALIDFQKQNRLPATGEIDETTVDAIQAALQKSPVSAPAANPATQGTGRQDLTLDGLLMQSRLGSGSSSPLAGSLPFLDAFQSAISFPQQVESKLQSSVAALEKNPYFPFGCELARNWTGAAATQSIQQFQSTATLNPDAMDLSNVLSEIHGNPQMLTPDNWLTIAQAAACCAESLLAGVNLEIPNSFGGFKHEPQPYGLSLLRQSGAALAGFMTGVAGGAMAPDAEGGSAIIAASSLSASLAATGFYSAEGSMLPMFAGMISNMMQQLPQLMRDCGVNFDLDNNPVTWITLNIAVTGLVTSIAISTHQQTVLKTDRQISSLVRTAVRSEIEMSGILAADALEEVLKHQEVATREILAASIQAMVALDTGNTDQIALVSTTKPQDLIFMMKTAALKILDLTGKIVEAARAIRING